MLTETKRPALKQKDRKMDYYFDTNYDGYAETIVTDYNFDGYADLISIDTDYDGWTDTFIW